MTGEVFCPHCHLNVEVCGLFENMRGVKCEVYNAASDDDKMIFELLDASREVVERWDTPLWKDVPATATYIARLRKAVQAMILSSVNLAKPLGETGDSRG